MGPADLGSRRPRSIAAFAATAALLLSAATVLSVFDARAASAAPALDERRFEKIYVIDFKGAIEPALSAYVVRSLKAAQAEGADCIVLRIESPGGRVDGSMEIADAILGLPKTIRTVAWVKKEAYSGATMGALACDEVVMAPQALIGDCQPILLTGDGFAPAGEKIETILRAQFRRYAADNGWDPLLCEKFVSKDRDVLLVRELAEPKRTHYVYGEDFDSAREVDLVAGVAKRDLERVRVVVAKNRLLTLTAAEAQEHGFVLRQFDAESALLTALSAPGAVVTRIEMSWREAASRWLLGVVGVLGAVLSICVLITMFQGVGLATAIGAIALLLIGLVTVTADLTNGFAFFLIALGLLLLAAEVFLLPGFGIAGVLGILSLGAGFLFLATGFTLERPGALSWDTTARFLGQFALTILVGGALLVLASRLLPSIPFARRHLHLSADGLGAGAVVLSGDVMPAVGSSGAAATDLRPAGRATIDGKPFDVTSEGGFVDAGTPLRVVRVEGARVIVRATPAPAAPASASRPAS